MNTDSATPPPWFSVVWNDSPGVVEKQLRFRQSFQSARPISGRPCGPLFVTVCWNERVRCSKLSLIHISEPTRLGMISYAVFCLKKKKKMKAKSKQNETINENNIKVLHINNN